MGSLHFCDKVGRPKPTQMDRELVMQFLQTVHAPGCGRHVKMRTNEHTLRNECVRIMYLGFHKSRQVAGGLVSDSLE